MADPIALLSVGATASVAIAVPWINFALERRRVRTQTNLARFDELRSVLDQAAVALAQCNRGLDDAEREVETAQATEATAEDCQAARLALRSLRDRLSRLGEIDQQLAVRLGDAADLVRHCRHAAEAYRDGYAILEGAAEAGPSSDDADAWREVVVPLEMSRQAAAEGRSAFVNAAAGLIGPQQ